MTANARRIVLTGASGVGKTTLVEMLAPLLSLSVIPEIARQLCQELGVAYPGELSDQHDFRQQVLDRQIAAEETAGSFISDRSTIDCWVLWERWQMATAMTYDSEKYYDQSREQALKYSHIIYVPPMFAPVEDGFRWTDKDYQKQIDRLIRFTIFDWQLTGRTLVLQTSDVQDRLKEIDSWLSSHNSGR